MKKNEKNDAETAVLETQNSEKKNLPVARVILKRGQSLFEVNKKSLEVRKAVFEKTDSDTVVKKLVIQPDCWYCPALNPKNAMRKYAQLATRIFAGQ